MPGIPRTPGTGCTNPLHRQGTEVSPLLHHTDRITPHGTHQAQDPRMRHPGRPPQTRPPSRSPGASRRGSGGTRGRGCPSTTSTGRQRPRGANSLDRIEYSTHPEADRDVVAWGPGAHDIAPDGVLVVRHGLARAPDDGEGVLWGEEPNVSSS